MQKHKNAVIFIGNTGVGKSTICNHLFEVCGSATRFESSSANFSETTSLQTGQITYNGQQLAIMDNPGFFDNSLNATAGGNDGPNMCKLIKALESCESIYAVVFVYTDRFSEPHKMWYDRIKGVLAEGTAGNGLRANVVLLHKKLGPQNELDKGRNIGQIETILGETGVEYLWYSHSAAADAGQVRQLLAAVTKHAPFKLDTMTVPDICYQSELLEPPYTEIISTETKDEGQMVQQSRQQIVYETRQKWADNPAGWMGIRQFGGKTDYQVPVTKTLVDNVWQANMVTRRVLAEHQRRYKVRFDGSKDLVETKELRRWEEKV